ncbi:hypothetical protein FJT64_019189 [Amphibalanus amphitrite]|uniref:Uncharacterized protein n=1 Tax=Amphibalanus amphitrite TaxID=1232801 RepID=A0A6A4X110_AMPAM|nr:hypothetical protein FJT64_019189 [Amphibalanus amphitrite]
MSYSYSPPLGSDDDDPLPAAEGAAAAAPVTDELGVDREALAFVAGYVASKCRHLCRGLGQPSSCSPASAFVPSRWLQTISRGNLYVPSEWWMEVVEDFNTRFCDVMGSTADVAPGIVKRLVACVLAKAPEVDERVARKLASTRLPHNAIRTKPVEPGGREDPRTCTAPAAGGRALSGTESALAVGQSRRQCFRPPQLKHVPGPGARSA